MAGPQAPANAKGIDNVIQGAQFIAWFHLMFDSMGFQVLQHPQRPVGLVMEHDFPASHHYCGPHDNAGKVPRDGMKRDEAFEKNRIYDYDKCFTW